jgi:hypothetical protein
VPLRKFFFFFFFFFFIKLAVSIFKPSAAYTVSRATATSVFFFQAMHCSVALPGLRGVAGVLFD